MRPAPLTIDSHQHFWRFNAARDAWITDEMRVLRRDYLPEDLAPELENHGIDATIAVQADQSEDETRFLLALADRNPFIAGVVGWVDLRADDLSQRLEDYSQFDKLRGFRHIVQAEDDRFLLRKDFQLGVSKLAEFGFTYDILIYARQLPAAVEFVNSLSDQPFVLDHIAKPNLAAHEIVQWERHIRAVAANPNVMCKVSGMVTEADWNNWSADLFQPYLEVVWDAFGVERLMFGSDWPVCLLAGSYGQVKQLADDFLDGRSEAKRNAFFGDNTARFYGLKEHGLRASR
jgi:L-fuconolactonase